MSRRDRAGFASSHRLLTAPPERWLTAQIASSAAIAARHRRVTGPTTGRLMAGIASSALVLLLAGCGLLVTAPPLPQRPTITSVVDGDTVIVDFGSKTETVRLLGIDTPEKSGGPRPAECFGAEATERLSQLLPEGTAVTVQRDVEARDQYGRLLAYLYRADDDLFINLAMVTDGYAAPLFFTPNTTVEATFSDAADRARRDQLGFWAVCGGADILLEPG